MSDDEYYEEYEDIFWIEEPDPDVADDLAATQTYDAVFFDNPALEAEDYSSDWDELSDDYYDDDPTVEKRRRMEHLVNNGKLSTGDQMAEKGTWNDGENSKPKPERKCERVPSKTPDPNSFQSVIWKCSDHDKNPVQILTPGEGEKVALLKNWREVFKNSHPSFDRSSRVRRQRTRKSLSPDVQQPVSSAPSKGQTLGAKPPPEDESKREVSTDWMSGDSSLENLRGTDGDSDSGAEMSNTSPEKSLSPPVGKGKKGKSKASVATNGSIEANGWGGASAVPSSSPMKGRKRKASISADGPAESASEGNNRSKRAATTKVAQDTQQASRKSTRQTRIQK